MHGTKNKGGTEAGWRRKGTQLADTSQIQKAFDDNDAQKSRASGFVGTSKQQNHTPLVIEDTLDLKIGSPKKSMVGDVVVTDEIEPIKSVSFKAKKKKKLQKKVDTKEKVVEITEENKEEIEVESIMKDES